MGRILFALSFVAIGALSLGFHDFAVDWELLPKWLAAYGALLTLSGVVLFAGGVALLVPRVAKPASLVVTGFLLLRLFLLHTPRVIAHPLVEVVYQSLSENLVLVAGGWTIFAMLPRDDGTPSGDVRIGQILFALALPAFGLSHFFYMNLTAPIIPAWIPFHAALGYFTGGAHIAAGLGILFGVLPRLAATLEAVMVSLFTVLVWPPIILAAPMNHSNWSEVCASAAISAAAWVVAESFRAEPWISRRR